MNNNIEDIYNTPDDTSPEDIKSYTSKEIDEEMSILLKYFSIVRLVNPYECHIVKDMSDTSDNNTPQKDICYGVWKYPYQCVNCTSARAMITKHTHSKLDILDNQIFHVTSRPVLVDEKPMVLEIVQPFSYTYERYDCIKSHNQLVNSIKTLNRSLLLDTETDAYNRDYISEHLPNLIYQARQTGCMNAALIYIKHLRTVTNVNHKDITEFNDEEYEIASSGIICTLFDIIKNTFSDESDKELLFARYNHDSFFVLETSLNFDIFSERIHSISLASKPEHILFKGHRMPFEVKTSTVDISKTSVNNECELFHILNENMKSNNQ